MSLRTWSRFDGTPSRGKEGEGAPRWRACLPRSKAVVTDLSRGYTAAAMSPRSAVRTVPTAHFADRCRPSVRATASLALFTYLFAACAHPTPTATIPTSRISLATNPPGHMATLEARLTALAASPTTAPSATRYLTRTPLATVTMYGVPATTPTRAPTATNTPISLLPAEPAPVVLSREEAAARALAWFLPEQAAKVVAVTYVSNVDFWEVVDRLGGDEVMRGEPGTAILTSTDRIQNSGASANDVLALVEVEAGPPRRLAPDFSYAPTWTNLPWDEGARESDRRRISYLFNATTGASLGSPYVGSGNLEGSRRPVWRALQARSIQVTVHIPSTSPLKSAPTATSTASASPVPTSQRIPGLPSSACLPDDAEPIRLVPDLVPAPLAESIRWLPYVEGARWTYERTISYNEAQWTRGLKLVQVRERWRLAEDAMLVRLSDVMTTILPPDASRWGFGKDPERQDQWLILLPGASYEIEGCRDNEPHSLNRRRQQVAAADYYSNRWEVLLDPAARGDYQVPARWRADESQTLPSVWSLSTGLVRGCRNYGLGANPSKWEYKGYMCPDVGWAADVESGCGSWFCRDVTDMLVSYHIPRWRVIP